MVGKVIWEVGEFVVLFTWEMIKTPCIMISLVVVQPVLIIDMFVKQIIKPTLSRMWRHVLSVSKGYFGVYTDN